MGKWTNAAQQLKIQIDANEKMAEDMKLLLMQIGELPPGQLKKVLTQPIIDILEKYDVILNTETE